MNSLQSWPHIIALLGGVALVAAGLLVTGLGFGVPGDDKNRSSRWHRHTL